MQFFVVYVKQIKKFQKYIKVNKIRNKLQQAIEKNKDIYYIPDFEHDFSIEKLLNIKKILNENDFNILIFYNEFRKDNDLLEDALGNLTKFSNSQIIRDY